MADDPTTDPATNDPSGDPATDPKGGDPATDAAAGEGALRALAAERRARQAAERKLADFENQHKTESEKAIDKARAEGRSEALTVANERLVRSEVIAALAGKVHNSGTAARLIDLASIPVDDDGNVDDKAVQAAIAKLLKDEPYLAIDGANGAQRSNGTGSGDQGPRGRSAAADSDMNQLIRRAVGR